MADFARSRSHLQEGKLTGVWITAAYGSALTAAFVWLSLRVAWRRWRLETYLGDGGDRKLLRLSRVHANFAENVPMCLIMMGFAEGLGAAPALIYGLGATLLAARAVHAYGVAQEPEPIWYRVIGYTATCCVLCAAALSCAVRIAVG